MLALREMLGPTKKKPKEKVEQERGEEMTIEQELAARYALKPAGIHAKCQLAGHTIHHVILDPGSLNSLVDRACAQRLGLHIRTRQLPDIELANGQMEKVYELKGSVRAEVEGIGADVAARCVNARGSYDVLPGQDWLRMTHCCADFSSQVHNLDGKVRVRQRGR